MKGRAKPIEQHRREGTFRADRHGPKVVQIGGRELPPPPPNLSRHQRWAWDYLLKDLSGSGTIDHVDAGIVEAAATFWGTARDAREILDKEKYVVKGDRGTHAHPAWVISRDAWTQFRMIADQLGLSPSARARLGIANVRKRTMQQEMDSKLGTTRLRAVKSAN